MTTKKRKNLLASKTFKIKFHFPPKINLCRSCEYAYGDVRKGLMCGITNRKPDFYAYCPYFKLNRSRDAAIHKYDDLKSRTKYGLIEFWTIMFILIVLLSPFIELLGRNAVFFIVALALLGYSIYTYLLKNRTNNLPIFAFSYINLAKLLLKHKPKTSHEDQLIVEQTLIRLFGAKIAYQAINLQPTADLNIIFKTLRNLSYLDRRFLFSLLCQLFVYNNLDGCRNETILTQIAQNLGLKQDELFRIKQIYLSKEYQYQSQKQQKHQPATRQLSIETYFKILGLPINATEQQIKSQFRKLAKLYHPDRQQNPQAAQLYAEHFRIILEAYEKIKQYKNIK